MRANRLWIAYTAQFSIEGGTLTLEPTTEVTNVRQKGNTSIGRTISDEPQWTVTVRELDGEPTKDHAEFPHELITEHTSVERGTREEDWPIFYP